MKFILDLIKERIVIFDGAMGTQLIDLGLKDGECPEAWNLYRPDDIRAIHEAYFRAGADVVSTNTFGGTPVKLAKYDLSGKAVEINARGVEIAKSICPPGKYVAGDMGPTGLFLPPVGNADINDIYSAFAMQAEILAGAGADLLIIETQYDLREALAALKAAKTTGLPVFVTMTFDRKKRGYFTIMGDTPEKAMQELAMNGADAAGANCNLDNAEYVELAYILCAASDLPVIIQPNAGRPNIEGDKVSYSVTEDDFTKTVPEYIKAGVRIIGSCCGSTPAFTKKITEAALISQQPGIWG